MLALIDGDIITYRVGYTTDNDEEWVVRARADEMLDGILERTKATEFQVWLSDSAENNFRYRILPEYKATRTQPRPRHYEYIKEYLITSWGARIAYGMEADDVLGINQDHTFYEGMFKTDGFQTVICSIDKDLQQIPGLHYNFVTNEWREITEWEGLKWFYKQILIGDVSDNVKGCVGIGPKKAGKALDQIGSEKGEVGLFEACFATYQKQNKKQEKENQKTDAEILNHIRTIGKVLKIKQTEDEEEWDIPKSNLMGDGESSSIQQMEVGTNPSMVPTILDRKIGDGSLQHGTPTEEKSDPTLLS